MYDLIGEWGLLSAIVVLGFLFLACVVNLIAVVCAISLFQACGTLAVLCVVSLILVYVDRWYKS